MRNEAGRLASVRKGHLQFLSILQGNFLAALGSVIVSEGNIYSCYRRHLIFVVGASECQKY